MRLTSDDQKEALLHKDWLQHLTQVLTHEERSVEEGPTLTPGVPNAIVKVSAEDPQEARRRTAVALGLIPASELPHREELNGTDLAALRLREAFTGESVEANIEALSSGN